jgi:hypothetical protein
MPALHISLLHTTIRPQKWVLACQAWYDCCDKPDRVEYVLTPEKTDAEWFFAIPFKHHVIEWNNGRPCAVDGFNYAAKLSHGQVLVIVADDFFPPPHWDSQLLGVLGRKASKEAVVWVSTKGENDSRFITLPILTRKYYERYGYVLWPEYQSWYSDCEFTEVAQRDGVIIDARKTLNFDHRYPWRPDLRQAPDEINLRQNNQGAEAELLYEKRKSAGFPR